MSPRSLRLSALLSVGLGLAPFAAGQSVYPIGTTVWEQGSTFDGYTIFPAFNGKMILTTWTAPT